MRYIDADALIEKIQETVCTKCGDIYDGIKCKSCGIDDTLNFLEDAPTADVVPREAYEALMINYERMRRNQFPSYCQAVTEEEAMKIGYERGRAEVAKIFEEIESVLFTVANPCPSADGTIIVKHSKDFYLRREDYYTIKEKYTKGGVEE